MEELHRPIVDLARGILRGSKGNILDLGCGNGALLAKICEGSPGIIPHGVDRNAFALEHVGILLPEYSANFKQANLFDWESWSSEKRYALTLLMVGRLLEVDRPVAHLLIKRLREQSDAILVYLYPGPEKRSLGSVAHEMGLLLEGPADAVAGLLRR
jgi:SAM-dependent methyltransferase